MQYTVAQMDPESRNDFFNAYESHKKKRSVACVILFLCGCHHLYTRNVGLQFALWFTSFLGIGLLWWIGDLFRMSGIVASCNEQIAREALQTLSTGQQFRSGNGTPGAA